MQRFRVSSKLIKDQRRERNTPDAIRDLTELRDYMADVLLVTRGDGSLCAPLTPKLSTQRTVPACCKLLQKRLRAVAWNRVFLKITLVSCDDAVHAV